LNRLLKITVGWHAALVAALVIAVVYTLISEPAKGERLSDFMKAYYAAGWALMHGGQAALKQLIDSAEFVNIPIVAWLFVPFAAIGPTAAKLTFTGIGLAAAVGAYVLLAWETEPARRPMLMLLFVANGPLWYSVLVGNTSHVILLILVLALLSRRAERDFSAGCLLGVAAIIKPMFLLFGVYFLVRGRWRVVAGGVAVIGVTILLTFALFGTSYTIDWYQHCIGTFSTKPPGAANNQSIDGFLLRLWDGTVLLRDWRPHDLSPGAHALKNLFVVSLALLIALTLWVGRIAPGHKGATAAERDDFEFSLILVACLVMSPVSWTHYYTVLLIVFGLCLARRLPNLSDRTGIMLIGTAVLLCSMPVRIPLIPTGVWGDFTSRSLDSCWFIGALVLLAALFRAALLPIVPGHLQARAAPAAPRLSPFQ